MTNRKIEKIIKPTSYNWVGDAFYVASMIGKEISRRRMDPFLVFDYNQTVDFSPREEPRGVGAHPHKGFETVTLAYQGRVAHKDSRGNSGVIGEGDVQWMTAGAGIMHQEYHEEEWSKQGGPFQMVQLWVNLPAKDKNTPAHYQDLKASDMPKVVLDNGDGTIDIVAGEYQGVNGLADTYSPVHLFNAYLNKNGQATFEFPNYYNTALLVINGSIKVNGEEVIEADSFVLFENNGAEQFEIEALSDDTKVLVLSGEPLNEPIAHYGPFVMNTQEELVQAFEDFQNGKFGVI